jgi:hypothetical protein
MYYDLFLGNKYDPGVEIPGSIFFDKMMVKAALERLLDYHDPASNP